MDRIASRIADRLARIAIAMPLLVLLASCGSGAVSGPPVVVTPGPITISPDIATVYSDLPTTFVISGGNGNYIITSSDQAVVPIAGAFTGGNALTIVPNQVNADTTVLLTVRDTAGTAPATARLTVKPRTVSNVVTVTPSASQSAACGSAICAGGDAEVAVKLAQGGVPLRNRTVRFDVVSGDFRIITSAPGQAEQLGLSATTTTDDTGTARMRIRVLPEATSQTALIQITDVNSGFTQRTSFAIAPSSNAPLNAQPSDIHFIGRDSSTCANGISADVIVFGGRPPYSISQPGTFTVSPLQLFGSGQRFSVTATGQCTPGSQIAVVDAIGASVAVTASNSVSTATVSTPAFVVSPTSVTLDSCTAIASVAVAGGLGAGSYFVSSGHNAVAASVTNNTGRIQRQPNTTITAAASPVTVSFSDGRSVAPVTVNLTGLAVGFCP